MTFRVLGSVGITSGTGLTALRGARQCTLLALLLLKAGEPVTKEQFFEELWEEGIPSQPGNALQAQVARLRKVLRAELGDEFVCRRLITRPSSYVLDVDPLEVDVHLFGSLTKQARGLMRNDPVAARELFDRALSLWRGAPLEGVTGGPICQSAAAQFEENRLSAVETRIQLDIAIDGYAQAVSELKMLAYLAPWRERLFELLMVCLYRLGRQAEAIQTYNQLRSRLVEEFGMEPSPSVKSCMMAILNQDPALGGAERLVVARTPLFSTAVAS
ncbi:BTAD domain-containing putative transcriptional regulator [Streptomyces sp. NPDC056178]|uniref:AfsR/SARP family transcriptional regulator n=1 Tax=unclassified Streptomyces TaxID=2593676 RepID=UPI0035DC63F6